MGREVAHGSKPLTSPGRAPRCWWHCAYWDHMLRVMNQIVMIRYGHVRVTIHQARGLHLACDAPARWPPTSYADKDVHCRRGRDT